MNDLADIRDSITRMAFDIKAEVVIADLFENGLPHTDLVVVPDGFSRRRFKKDVSHAEVAELGNGQEILAIHLTREGLYDALPEALFHGIPNEDLNNGHEMARVSKTQKLEERGCRRFFQPFENEIFFQKVQLELAERKILQRFSENLFNDIFPEFWNLDRSLPGDLVSRLILFLHYAHKCAGNTFLTARALSMILNEPVEIRVREHPAPGRETQIPADHSPLGSCALGYDLICGDRPAEPFPVMEFLIGPLQNSNCSDYLENGRITRLLKVFYDYFVPLEMIPGTRVRGTTTEQEFTLSDKTPAYLGYNTHF